MNFSFLKSTRSFRPSSLRKCGSPSRQRAFIHQSHSCRNEGGGNAYRAKHMSALSPTMMLLGFMPIFTFALGTWQIQRLKWKVNLIDELSEKLQRLPMNLPRVINTEALSEFTLRKVLLKGRWDHAHTILIGPRVHDGTKGYHVITPFIRNDGSTVLVDRGFVSDDYADINRWRNQPHISSEVEVLGMIRTAQKRNRFTPNNNPAKDEWYWVDVDALVENAGGQAAGVQPVYIESIFDGHSGDAQLAISRGEPVGRAPTVELRNQHATYAITWYSLSIATTFMFVHLLRRRAKAPNARMPR